jgi:FkbM family methyltransferase
MSEMFAMLVQAAFHRFGFHIRRVEPGVSYGDPLAEIARLAGPEVRQIVEVGAADGRDTLKFAEAFPNASVVAFEPLPENYAKLAAGAAGNTRIRAIEAAMSDSCGRRAFYVTNLADASSLLRSNVTGSTFDRHTRLIAETTVAIETLDDFFKDQSIDILKMDAQGSEMNILRGARTLLEAGKIRLIYTEVNFLRIYEGIELYHDIAKYLEQFDYSLHNLYGLVHNQTGRLAWGNPIFLRPDHAV